MKSSLPCRGERHRFWHIFPPSRRRSRAVSQNPLVPRFRGGKLQREFRRLSFERFVCGAGSPQGGSPRRRHLGAPRDERKGQFCYCSAATARGENCAGGMIRAEVVRALNGEKVRQPRARAIDPALNRADRAVADGGGLLVRKSRCPNEDQRLPLV